MQALNQIVDNKYARAYEGIPNRLDVGIATGGNIMVELRSRAWVWRGYKNGEPVIKTAKQPGESYEEWHQRMVVADQTEWRDGLGWVTVPSKIPELVPEVPRAGSQ